MALIYVLMPQGSEGHPTGRVLCLQPDASYRLQHERRQRRGHQVRQDGDEQDALPRLHAGLDARGQEAHHRCLLGGVHPVERAHLQL